MTNPIAIGLLTLIAGALVFDAMTQDWAYSVFVARKGVQFLEWIAFWR